jgi:hypothetical protein
LDGALRFLGGRRPTTFDLGWQARIGSPQLSCCSTNGPRGIGVLSEWAVMVAAAPLAAGLAVNFYGACTVVAPAPSGRPVQLSQVTAYPLDGAIQLLVAPEVAESFTLHLRIPSWSRSTRVLVNGQSLATPAQPGTYLGLTRRWQAGDQVALTLDMSPRLWVGESRPLDALVGGGTSGRMAIYHGPILMAYDPRFDPDPRGPMVAIDLSWPPRRLDPVAGQPELRVEYRCVDGRFITLCDFASAGQVVASDAARFVRGSVTALSTQPGGKSLFAQGAESKVWSNFFPAADRLGEWNGWFTLGDNVFPAGSAVTALSTRPGGTSLYVLGLDGKVWTNFFPAADGAWQWNGWFALGDNEFPAGTTVAALSTEPGGTSLYVRGAGDAIWTNYFPAPTPPNAWSGWWPLIFPPYASWLPAPSGLQPVPFSQNNPLRAQWPV